MKETSLQPSWHQQQPNYQKRFKHLSVGFITANKTPVFYCHSISIPSNGKDGISTILHLIYFSKRKGIVSQQHMVDEVQSETQIIEFVMNKDKQGLIKKPSAIKLKWLYNGKVFSMMAKTYCDLLDTSYYEVFNDVIDGYEYPNFKRHVFSKEEINLNARFKYAKSLTLTKVMHIEIRKFISQLPNHILYLMRRHNDFCIETFNFLYAKNDKIKQLRRQDSMQAHAWYLTKFEKDKKKKSDLIKHIDSGQSIGDFIRKAENASHGVIKFLHGLSYNHWKKCHHGLDPEFLGSIQHGLSVFKGIKTSQKSLRFFADLAYDQAAATSTISGFDNIHNLAFNIESFGFLGGKNCVLSSFSREFSSCWNEHRSVDKLQELRVSLFIIDLRDYLRHLILFVKNGKKFKEIITLRRLVVLSKNWHDNLPAIDRLRSNIFEEFVILSDSIDQKWSAVIEKSKLNEDYDIVELTSKSQLSVEGARMSHCVGTYYTSCAFHNVHIFSVRDKDGDSQSTFEVNYTIDKESTLKINLVQHRAHKNSQPPKEIVNAVNQWIKDHHTDFVQACPKLQEECNRRLDVYHGVSTLNQETIQKAERNFFERALVLFPNCYPSEN